jgi:hypothetical protein
MGIIKSIVTGAGIAYLDHAAKLREMDARYDSGLGDYLLGAFWMVAPPPLRNLDRSLSYYERAAGLAPFSVRNQFGLGVYWARREDSARARSHFEKVVALPCVAGTSSGSGRWRRRGRAFEPSPEFAPGCGRHVGARTGAPCNGRLQTLPAAHGPSSHRGRRSEGGQGDAVGRMGPTWRRFPTATRSQRPRPRP